MSLSRVVQFLVEHNPSLQDALERGYANFSAVARLLKPKAEEILGKEVTIEGLISAVKRAKTTIIPNLEHHKIIANSIINLRTDVAKISLEKTRRNLEKARLASADFPEAFFQVLEGATTLTLITDQRIFPQVQTIFPGEATLEAKQDLAAVILQSPSGIVDTPGCIVAFYNSLSKHRINIEETISCFTETIIVLSMKDAARAFALLTDLITNARKAITS